jgi:hypothetical protein
LEKTFLPNIIIIMCVNFYVRNLVGKIVYFIILASFSLQHPVSWQPSADGTRLLGHMVLQKGVVPPSSVAAYGGLASGASATAMLGLKVIGGRVLPGGRVGAVVEKVKKGSIADTVGRLLPGKKTIARSLLFLSRDLSSISFPTSRAKKTVWTIFAPSPQGGRKT